VEATGAAGARRPLLHWVLLAGLVVMWGSSPALTKFAVAGLAPIVIVAMRLMLGALILWSVLIITGRKLPRSFKHWAFFTASAFFGNALPFFLITWGQQEVPSGLTAVFFAIMPLSTLLLAHLFVAGERLTMRRFSGFAVGFLGMLVLVGPEALAEIGGAPSRLVFELAILTGAFCYAINAIIARLRPACDVIEAATGTLTMAALLTLPWVLMTADPIRLAPGADPGVDEATMTLALLAVVGLGAFGTALPTLCFFNLVTLAGPSFVALINYLIPVWGLMLGLTLMAEPAEARALLALPLILGGITLAERGRGRR